MPIDDLTALGQKMREARKNKELTQQELSDLSHVSVKQIANIEKGKIKRKICQFKNQLFFIQSGWQNRSKKNPHTLFIKFHVAFVIPHRMWKD